jgi:hypothetical protein
MPLDPDVAELALVLHEMASLFRAHHTDGFANMLDDCRIAIERRDPNGLMHLVRMYGGRGSLNILESDLGDDQRFQALNRKAFQLADRLRLEHDAWERSSESVAEPAAPASSSTLLKAIGITAADGVLTLVVPAGQQLPDTRSQTLTTANAAGEVAVTLSQQDASGSAAIAEVRVPIPMVTGTTLDITVTLKISAAKVLRIKTTVNQTAESREFGPWLVH